MKTKTSRLKIGFENLEKTLYTGCVDPSRTTALQVNIGPISREIENTNMKTVHRGFSPRESS